MDPITACSLFTNVITIVDAAIKASKTIRELYTSSTGFSKETQRLKDEMAHLETITATLAPIEAQLSSVPQQRLLTKVVDECSDVSKRFASSLTRSR
jgi:hypothetical protein